MKKFLARFSIAVVVVMAFTILLSGPAAADPSVVTVVGEVNDQYQIIDQDGITYEIADTELGNEVLQRIGAVVEVTGDLTEQDGVKVLDVITFKVKEEL